MLFLIEAPADTEDLQAMSDAGSLRRAGQGVFQRRMTAASEYSTMAICQSTIDLLESAWTTGEDVSRRRFLS